MSASETRLESIITGCLRGNRNSQRKLYEHFFGYGMNICLRYSKNREEAEEILNNGFLKVFRSIDRYNPDYPFRTWLRRILINTSIDYFRSNKKYPVFLELHKAADVTDEPLPMPKLSPEEDVLPVVQALSPMYRMVFNLSVMEGYKHDEIAEMLDISASASRSNLARAKEKLRQLLLAEKGDKHNPKAFKMR